MTAIRRFANIPPLLAEIDLAKNMSLRQIATCLHK